MGPEDYTFGFLSGCGTVVLASQKVLVCQTASGFFWLSRPGPSRFPCYQTQANKNTHVIFCDVLIFPILHGAWHLARPSQMFICREGNKRHTLHAWEGGGFYKEQYSIAQDDTC